MRFDRIRGQPLIAVRLRDIAGEQRAHRTVGVADIKPERFALTLVDKRFCIRQQLRIQHAVIKRRVVLSAVERFARMWLSGLQQFA